jgi:hypothetical protein
MTQDSETRVTPKSQLDALQPAFSSFVPNPLDVDVLYRAAFQSFALLEPWYLVTVDRQ